MPRGLRIAVAFYPGRIGMPEHTAYPVVLNGKLGAVLLVRHLTPVEAVDFENLITRETGEGRTRWTLKRPITIPTEGCIALEGNGQLLYVLEDGVQYYRLFRPRNFTELFIAFEVEDIASITDEQKSRHEQILDQFLLAYRAFTGDVAVRMLHDLAGDYPVIRMGSYEYNEDELRLPDLERITRLRTMDVRIEGLPLGINPNVLTPPFIDPDRAGPVISAFLRSGEAIPKPQEVLIKATEELKISLDYNYAFLLASFAIEQVLTDFLEDVKKHAGIPENTIKAYQGDVGMAYKINVELPLVVRADHAVRQLIPDLKGTNTIRNAIVHKGRTATYEEAVVAIQTGDKLIKALMGEVFDVP
jgi:hypothetical protein